MKKTKTLLIRGVPEELHRELKHIAVDEGDSMTGVVRRLIREAVERRRKRDRREL